MAAGSAAKVLLACDTRPSSPALMAAAAAGVQALGGLAVDCGRLTTPQLHWQLRRLNQGLPWALEDYFSTLAGAYQQLVKGTEPLGQVRASVPFCPALVMCFRDKYMSHMLTCTASPGMLIKAPHCFITACKQVLTARISMTGIATSFHYRHFNSA